MQWIITTWAKKKARASRDLSTMRIRMRHKAIYSWNNQSHQWVRNGEYPFQLKFCNKWVIGYTTSYKRNTETTQHVEILRSLRVVIQSDIRLWLWVQSHILATHSLKWCDMWYVFYLTAPVVTTSNTSNIPCSYTFYSEITFRILILVESWCQPRLYFKNSSRIYKEQITLSVVAILKVILSSNIPQTLKTIAFNLFWVQSRPFPRRQKCP